MSDSDSSRSAIRVLYVDDNRALIRAAQRLLPRLGFPIEAFADPTQAVDAFRRNPDAFDILVTDLTMPELTGLDVTAQVRAIRGDLPVILSTGYLSEFASTRARELGVDRILAKPVDADEMIGVLRELCA